ncbi:MAG: DUF1674 domain-containing protein [Bacteroidales bacterium]|nr:DUF1674 domain-containing protein [Bacteroidales bacterium]
MQWRRPEGPPRPDCTTGRNTVPGCAGGPMLPDPARAGDWAGAGRSICPGRLLFSETEGPVRNSP